MSFLAGHWLWLLLAVAALLVLYMVFARRRGVYAARLSSAALLASVMPRRPQWWRRHVPAALMLFALVATVIALARPASTHKVPKERATVMMAIDVSNSMAATDVKPNRLAAAEDSAVAFVDQLPAKINLGLVSFSGTAAVVVPPSTDREAMRAAIRALQLGPATAIGEGIFASLQAIDTINVQLGDNGQSAPPAAIVLMSDGETTRGRPNTDAVFAARDASVPVHTIAYGTPEGTLDVGGQQIPVPVNKDALRVIASGTGGTFHGATSGDELTSVYHDLGSSIGYRAEHREITSWFVGLSLLLGLAAGTSSILFGSRLP
ncbi:VWA domain-containing protein [Frankia sp. Cppng1_Ct_nod]|uniref:VWA domain-containing protein n=1 Tax=Frankia sp. Cppng1_Ct_nod TaxID=2897162 RepID=UPI001041B31F|nr:VWA domain-containing protein [Frankia sp. Cppng1_Ct_nod]